MNLVWCLFWVLSVGAAESSTPAAISSTTVKLADEAGQIIDLRGEVKVEHASGVIERPIKRESAYVGDVYITKDDGWVSARLRDGSEFSLGADSRLRIEKINVDQPALKRQIVLRLNTGQVRCRVEKQYKDANYFQVATAVAIASVRGTDFITSFSDDSLTEVRVLKGLVKLEKLKSESDGKKLSINIPGGTFASVSERLSPLYQIKAADTERFKHEEFVTSRASAPVDITRAIASEAPVCKDPTGLYNQCSWSCVNNPKNESKCRTDLSKVKCVRHLCRANGKWEEETELPATESQRCGGSGNPVVGDCEGYW